MQTQEMQLSADQIVEETSDWPEDAIADLVDRILRAKYGEADLSVHKAWRDETRRRLPKWRAAEYREYRSKRLWQKRAKSPARRTSAFND